MPPTAEHLQELGKRSDMNEDVYLSLPTVIQEALEPSKKGWNIFKKKVSRGSAASQIYLFRNDDIQKKYVEPFLKQFKIDEK